MYRLNAFAYELDVLGPENALKGMLLITFSKEVLFLSAFVCFFANRITQKVMKGFYNYSLGNVCHGTKRK